MYRSKKLFFASSVRGPDAQRELVEAALIYHLQPRFNTRHKSAPPQETVRIINKGDVPKHLRPLSITVSRKS